MIAVDEFGRAQIEPEAGIGLVWEAVSTTVLDFEVPARFTQTGRVRGLFGAVVTCCGFFARALEWLWRCWRAGSRSRRHRSPSRQPPAQPQPRRRRRVRDVRAADAGPGCRSAARGQVVEAPKTEAQFAAERRERADRAALNDQLLIFAALLVAVGRLSGDRLRGAGVLSSASACARCAARRS